MEDPLADDLVRAAHIQQCLSYSISAEGVAMMVFRIATQNPTDDSRFAITLPVAGLKAFRTLISDMIAVGEKRGMSTGMATIHEPRSVNVGHIDAMRNRAILSFNTDADDEAVFALPNDVGLSVAEALQKDIFARMTDEERRAHIVKQSRLLGPSRPKLILPHPGSQG